MREDSPDTFAAQAIERRSAMSVYGNPEDPQIEEEADEASSAEEPAGEETTTGPVWNDQGLPTPLAPEEESGDEELVEEE
jgi:hypothetical protein